MDMYVLGIELEHLQKNVTTLIRMDIFGTTSVKA